MERAHATKSSVTGLIVLFATSIVSIIAGAFLFDHPLNLLDCDYLYGNDVGAYQSSGLMGLKLWQASGRMWGYVPDFMAGFPWLRYTSGSVWSIVFVALHPLKMGTRTAIFMLSVLGMIPFAYYFAARAISDDRNDRIVAAILGTMTFFLGPNIFLWWMGQVEGCLSVLLSIMAISCYLRWMRLSREEARGATIEWIMFVAFSSLALIAHSMAGLFIAVMVLVSLPFVGHTKRTLAMLALGGVIGLAINSFWIIPGREYFHYYSRDVGALWAGKQKAGFFADLFTFLTPGGSFVTIWVVVVAGVVGLRALRSKDNGTSLSLAIGLILWTLVAYVGEFVDSLDPMQPRRFLVFVISLMALPAAIGAKRLLESHTATKRAAIVWVVVLLALITPNAFTRIMPFRLLTDVPVRLKVIAQTIRDETPSGARPLIEDTININNPVFMGGYFPPLLNAMTGREVLSQWLTAYKIKHNATMLHDGMLLGKKISDVSPDELSAFLDLYNVGAILCFSDETKKRLNAAAPLVEHVRDVGAFGWYIVHREPSYVIGGKADVMADVNRIVVKNLVRDGKDIVLKYHFDKRLATEPQLAIEPAYLGGDEVGFIKIVQPPRDFTIYFRY